MDHEGQARLWEEFQASNSAVEGRRWARKEKLSCEEGVGEGRTYYAMEGDGVNVGEGRV